MQVRTSATVSTALPMVLAMMAAPALAQEVPPTSAGADANVSAGKTAAAGETSPAEIVVTGSRISRSDYVSQTPVLTTNKAAIEASGVPTVDAYLLQLPQFQPGAGSFSSTNNGGAIGLATLNLRGLGPQRNLVLVDGRRFQPSTAETVVDINNIPSSAIGNIEIISGGASATYGSDAVAGVVNFKLRQRFRGLEFTGQIGVSEAGDAGNRQIAGVWGTQFADGRGSVMVAGEYVDRDVLTTQDRRFSRTTGNLSTTLPEGILVPNANNLPSQAAVNAIFVRYGITGTVPRTAQFGFNTNGTLFRSALPAENYLGSRSAPIVLTRTAFGTDGGYFSYLQVPLERRNALVRGEYALGDGITVYAQGVYARTKASGRGSEPLVTGVTGQLTVPVTNVFIPADLRQLLASRPNPNAPLIVNTRFSFDGPRTYSQTSELNQIVLGIRGDLAGLGWTYDLYGSRGRTNITERTIGGAISLPALRQLAGAADGGLSQCAGGYNPFGVNAPSRACLDFVTRRPVNKVTVEQDVIEGTLSGGIVDLPAGTAKFALNGNYRRNAYSSRPDALLRAGAIAPGLVTPATSGRVRMFDIGAEVLLPVIDGLNATLGYRYAHYKPSGPVSTYKADFDWRIVPPLLLRGGYQRAVRAPNVGEFFLGSTTALQQLGSLPSGGDPCDTRSALRTGGNAAAVRSLCIAQGISAGIVDSYQFSGVSTPGTSSGNPGLDPEKADTFTIGAVLQPTFLGPLFRRFSLSVDYYNIEISEVIASIDAATLLQKCFNSDGSNPNYAVGNEFCGYIRRDPNTGNFEEIRTPLLNLGGYKTAGIDVQADWTIPLASPDTSVTLNSVVNYLDNFRIQTLSTTPFQDFGGTVSAQTSYPRWKMLNSITVNAGPFRVGGRWRHTSRLRDRSTVANPASTITGAPAYDYFDLNGAVSVGSSYEFRVGVNNVGNKRPPIIGGALGATNLGVYDIIGRAFYAGIRAKF